MSFRVFPPGGSDRLGGVSTALSILYRLRPSFVDIAFNTNNDLGYGHAVRLTGGVGRGCRIRPIIRLAYLRCGQTRVSRFTEVLATRNVRGILTLHKSQGPSLARGSSFGRTSSLVSCLGPGKSFYFLNTYCPRYRPRSTGGVRRVHRLGRGMGTKTRILLSRLFFSGARFCHFIRSYQVTSVGIPVIPNVVPIVGTTRVGQVVAVYKTSFPRHFRGVVRGFRSGGTTLFSTNVSCTLDRVVSLLTGSASKVRLCAVGGPIITHEVYRKVRRVV